MLMEAQIRSYWAKVSSLVIAARLFHDFQTLLSAIDNICGKLESKKIHSLTYPLLKIIGKDSKSD